MVKIFEAIDIYFTYIQFCHSAYRLQTMRAYFFLLGNYKLRNMRNRRALLLRTLNTCISGTKTIQYKTTLPKHFSCLILKLMESEGGRAWGGKEERREKERGRG